MPLAPPSAELLELPIAFVVAGDLLRPRAMFACPLAPPLPLAGILRPCSPRNLGFLRRIARASAPLASCDIRHELSLLLLPALRLLLRRLLLRLLRAVT